MNVKLTTSEARAEACTLLLRLILRRTPPADLAWLHAESMREARCIGHPDITEEVEWIFHGLDL